MSPAWIFTLLALPVSGSDPNLRDIAREPYPYEQISLKQRKNILPPGQLLPNRVTVIICLGHGGTHLRDLSKADLETLTQKNLLGSRLIDLVISNIEAFKITAL